jgi:hypothetical protein
MDHFKIFVILSHVFPIILHNIELYIYIVRYKSDIKIPDFFDFFNLNIKKVSKKSKINFILKKNTKNYFVFVLTAKT